MEVLVVDAKGVSQDCILSIRAAGTRRQGSLSSTLGKPFKFKCTAEECTSIKVDFFAPVGTARAMCLEGAVRECTLPLQAPAGHDEAPEAEVSIQVRPAVDAPPPPPEKQEDQEQTAGYLEEHGLLVFLQGLLQDLMKDKPPVPFDYICQKASAFQPALVSQPQLVQLLHEAARSGNKEEVQALLKKGASPNATAKTGETPLMSAVVGGNSETVKLLIYAGAKPNRANGDGDTPLIWAVRYGHLKIIELLKERGADEKQPNAFGILPVQLLVARTAEVEKLFSNGKEAWEPEEKAEPWHNPEDTKYLEFLHCHFSREGLKQFIEKGEERAITLWQLKHILSFATKYCGRWREQPFQGPPKEPPVFHQIETLNLYNLNTWFLLPRTKAKCCQCKGFMPDYKCSEEKCNEAAICICEEKSCNFHLCRDHSKERCIKCSCIMKKPPKCSEEECNKAAKCSCRNATCDYHLCAEHSKDLELSMVEHLTDKPQPPNWFCSHWWGEPIKAFVRCVEYHAKSRKLEDDTAYWVCAYANRQHRLDEDISADPRESSFYRAMALSKFHVVLILDEEMKNADGETLSGPAKPFTRIWCAFELSMCLDQGTTLDIASTINGEVSLLTKTPLQAHTAQKAEMKYLKSCTRSLTRTGRLAQGAAESHFPLSAIQVGMKVELEKAESTMESDRVHILNSIAGRKLDLPPEEKHTKYDETNKRLRGLFAEAAFRRIYLFSRKDKAKPADKPPPADHAQKEDETRLADNPPPADHAQEEDKAQLADKSHRADTAQVEDNAQPADHAQEEDKAQLADKAQRAGTAQVEDNAQPADHTQVEEKSQLADNPQLADHAQVEDNAQPADDAQLVEAALLAEEALLAELKADFCRAIKEGGAQTLTFSLEDAPEGAVIEEALQAIAENLPPDVEEVNIHASGTDITDAGLERLAVNLPTTVHKVTLGLAGCSEVTGSCVRAFQLQVGAGDMKLDLHNSGASQELQDACAKPTGLIEFKLSTSEQTQQLLDAALNGDKDVVSELLEKGASPNSPSDEGDTALTYAVMKRHVEIVVLLLSKGATAKASNRKGETPLHFAARDAPNDRVITLLLEKGADADAADNDGNRPLHCAAEYEQTIAIRVLLAQGANRDLSNNAGFLPVQLARNIRVKHLFNKEATDFFNCFDFNDYYEENFKCLDPTSLTGLYSQFPAARRHREEAAAAEEKKVEIQKAKRLLEESDGLTISLAVQMLIEAGGNLDAAGEDGWTRLYIPARSGHAGVIRVLLEGRADVNQAPLSGDGPLWIAAKCGHLEAVKVLVEGRADLTLTPHIGPEQGTTPLVIASQKGHKDVVEYLRAEELARAPAREVAVEVKEEAPGA